jgi:hypothetical protein
VGAAGRPQTLTFLLVTIGGMENLGLIEKYREGIAAAEAILMASMKK